MASMEKIILCYKITLGKELFMTKKELNFFDKIMFTFILSLSVAAFIILWTLITLGIYIGKNGNSINKVSLVIAVFLIPPIITYLLHRFFLIYFFKRQYISKLSLLKLKNFFGNLSLVLLAVLSTVKNHIPSKILEEYNEPPPKDPIGYIEHVSILLLQPVNTTYLIPIVFAIISFLFSFLETSNFATYKIYTPKDKKPKMFTKKEITKKEIIYLQNIAMEIKINLEKMHTEINNFKRIHY